MPAGTLTIVVPEITSPPLGGTSSKAANGDSGSPPTVTFTHSNGDGESHHQVDQTTWAAPSASPALGGPAASVTLPTDDWEHEYEDDAWDEARPTFVTDETWDAIPDFLDCSRDEAAKQIALTEGALLGWIQHTRKCMADACPAGDARGEL